jgi:deoxycytidine triphosphate deaminase
MTPDASVFQDYDGLAQSDEEARSRFASARGLDPFPEIPASLLNSADVYEYVRLTGMLHPFRLEELKSASYEARIKGKCVWWDEEGRRQEIDLGTDAEQFVLRNNSIAFVQVEPYFRMPDYIALRFNLKITHVHRGILLGTGPLVDPGFEGRLLIPLHNLTTNDYTFKTDEGLIWIEFTKTSPLPGSPGVPAGALTRRGEYRPFPEKKKNLQPQEYLAKAAPHTHIRSSIPVATRLSREAAERSARDASAAAQTAQEIERRTSELERTIRRYSFWSVALGAVAVVALAIATWALIQDTWNVARTVDQRLQQEMAVRQQESRKVDELLRRVESTEKTLGGLRPAAPAPKEREGRTPQQGPK